MVHFAVPGAWGKRPENVIAGMIAWADYRPSEHPRHVRIFHHKTGETVLQPLEENGRLLYPILHSYRGVGVLLRSGDRPGLA
jgi:hypothetical protein